ncbi:transcription factor WhiB [Blastococcus colisei]|uniref:Transcriptional regulator WhiB n=1 Tax=Blastococcus colisei TaxID=1564162 RepID=A0A543PJZ2_9ACTN|nr:WhiB family transcriptional regulator [Blastococcus colisei]TQN44391.1 transcription factor WhiB [Blastococcus colisei]
MAQCEARLGQVCGIPSATQAAWSALAAVLAVDGPAPCEEGDPAAWWPAHGDDPDDVALAVRCCADCPARVECLAFALAADERDGIWGGLDRAQRLALARPMAA